MSRYFGCGFASARLPRMAKALQRAVADRPEKPRMLLKSLVNRSFEVVGVGVGVVRVRRAPTNRRRWQITG
jgi:hypothetical protein